MWYLGCWTLDLWKHEPGADAVDKVAIRILQEYESFVCLSFELTRNLGQLWAISEVIFECSDLLRALSKWSDLNNWIERKNVGVCTVEKDV